MLFQHKNLRLHYIFCFCYTLSVTLTFFQFAAYQSIELLKRSSFLYDNLRIYSSHTTKIIFIMLHDKQMFSARLALSAKIKTVKNKQFFEN